jgi:hypothetical protein
VGVDLVARDRTVSFDLAGLMRWRAVVARGAQGPGYAQTPWHTWKRLESRAREHERLAHDDDGGSCR